MFKLNHYILVHQTDSELSLIDIVAYINPYSVGIDFRRQILTSKVDPRTVSVNILILAETHNIGIQMNR